MSKFTSSHFVAFEFDISEAVHILSDPVPKQALHDYFVTRHGASPEAFVSGYNSEELAKALGKHLAEQKIAEAKQLPLSSGNGGAF